jgi:hypothetical protein
MRDNWGEEFIVQIEYDQLINLLTT